MYNMLNKDNVFASIHIYFFLVMKELGLEEKYFRVLRHTAWEFWTYMFLKVTRHENFRVLRQGSGKIVAIKNPNSLHHHIFHV